MTKVLVYSNRKIDPIIIDASTPEKEAAAFLKLFKHLDEDWQVYSAVPGNVWEQKRINLARSDDAQAAKELFIRRKNEEYEQWYESQMFDPLTEKIR